MRSVIELLLPILGLFAPPIITWILVLIGERTAAERGIRLPRLHTRIAVMLLQATLFLLMYLVLRRYLVPGIIPGNTLALLFMILGGQYLWFLPGRRILQAQDEALRLHTDREEVPSPPHSVRMASLKHRHIHDFIPDRLTPLPWIITGIMLILFLWRVLLPGLSQVQRFGSLGFILLGIGELALYAVWLRREVAAPQRLGPADDDETINSWYELRAYRVRAVFIMHTILPVFMILAAIVMLESFRGSIGVMTAVIIGGGGGAFLGLCGGLIGVFADIKRRRHDVIRSTKRIDTG